MPPLKKFYTIDEYKVLNAKQLDNPFSKGDDEDGGEYALKPIEVAKKTAEDKKKEPKFKKDLNIQPVSSERDDVFHLEKQKAGILPGMGMMIISGTTGSGKSVLICNLLGKKSMLKGYFEKIFIWSLSPCPVLEETLKIKKSHIFHEDNPNVLLEILEKQKEIIENMGFKQAPRILLICDDCAQSKTFLKHPVLTELAFAGTHSKVAVWLTTQSYVQIPRHVRINAHYLILMHGLRKSEIDRFSDEFESPYLTKREFETMVRYATKDPYSFLFVNNKHKDKADQFRIGFDKIINLNKNRII